MILLLRKIRYVITLLKLGDFKTLFHQLKRNIYSKDLQIGIVKKLDEPLKALVECKVKYHLQEASKEDMTEVFQKVKTESHESTQILLTRKWLYECDCGKWFVAKTVDTDELCFIKCVISPEDNKLLDKGLKNWFPKLKEDEIYSGGAYVFEKFRGNRLALSVSLDVSEIYRKKGFKRMILHIGDDNESGLKKMEGLGFVRFEEVIIHKCLFFSKRKSKLC